MELEKEYSCIENNDLVLSKNISIDKSYQETPEAYLDDICKVVRCTSHSYITSCDIRDSCAYIIGKTEICLTYFNDSDELIYTDFVEDFDETVEIGNVSENAFCYATVCNKYCNYRMINQRRIDIHSSFCISLYVYDKKSCSCISKCENSKLQLNKSKIACVDNAVLSKLDIEESFVLPSNSNGIKRVVCFNVECCSVETKIIKDKILVKASMSLYVLYSNNDNCLDRAEYSFDISKIVDVPGVDEVCHCVAKICNGSLFVKAKSTDEDNGGVIDIYGDLYLTCVTVREKVQELVFDGYVLNADTSNKYSTFNCLSGCEMSCRSNSSKLNFELQNEIVKVEFLCVTPYQCSIKNNKLIVEFEICLMYVGKDNTLQYVNQIKAVEQNVTSVDLANDIRITSFDYTISGDKTICVNISYDYCGYCGNEASYNILSEMEIIQERKSYPALTLYFAKQNERVWDIAKQFSSDIEMIKKENNITGDCLETNKVILIPGI